jgi:hypothetical protein
MKMPAGRNIGSAGAYLSEQAWGTARRPTRNRLGIVFSGFPAGGAPYAGAEDRLSRRHRSFSSASRFAIALGRMNLATKRRIFGPPASEEEPLARRQIVSALYGFR